MTVYVDDMRANFGRMVMCHMIADTEIELHNMARRIGVARKWFQDPATMRKVSHPHYDICLSKKALAVSFGAVEITQRQCAAMQSTRQRGYPLLQPEAAVLRFRELIAGRVNANVIRAPEPSRQGMPDMDSQGGEARLPEYDLFDRVR